MKHTNKLNVGCGKNIKKGFINIDIIKLHGVDKVVDLNEFPYPFKSESFDTILCSHVLEHLKDLSKVMNELHRILKKNGRLIIKVPHFTHSGSFADPTHIHFFGYNTFDYFMKDNSNFDYYFKFSFSKIEKKIIFGKKFALWNYIIGPIANLLPAVYENTPFRIFPAQELHIILIK